MDCIFSGKISPVPIAAPRYFFLLLFFALAGQATGQRYYTYAAADTLIDSLVHYRVLSETGARDLRIRVSKKDLPRHPDYPVFATEQKADSVSAGQVLTYLHGAYYSAVLHRLGFGVQLEVLEEWMKRPGFRPDNPLPEAFRAEVGARLRNLPGYRTELRIEAERLAAGADTVRLANFGATIYAPMSTTSHYTDAPVPDDRSVVGYDMALTLEGLHAAGLIADSEYVRYRRQLDTGEREPDYSYLAALARAAGEQEERVDRIRERRRLLNEWRALRLIGPDTAALLLADTVLLAAPAPDTLFPYLRNFHRLHLRPAPEPATMMARLREALIDLDTTFRPVVLDAETLEATPDFVRFRWRARIGDSVLYTSPPQYRDAGSSQRMEPYTDWPEVLATVNAYLRHRSAPYRIYTYDHHSSDGEAFTLPVLLLDHRGARAVLPPPPHGALGELIGPWPDAF